LIDTYNRQLEQALLKKYDAVKNEDVSSEQLALLFKQIEGIIEHEAESADQKLKAFTEPEAKEAEKPRSQPPRRREIPAHLPLVLNTIAVPSPERACSLCGVERVCIACAAHGRDRRLSLQPNR